MRALLFLGLLAAAAPAAAQIAGRHDYGDVSPPPRFGESSRLPGPGIGRDLGDIHGRIERGRETGQLSRGEARQLRREAHRIGSAAERYARDGLSHSESLELEARAHILRDAVLVAATTERRGRHR